MIERDEAKRRTNLEKHKVDFAIAEGFDWATAFVGEDDRFDYGEARFVASARSAKWPTRWSTLRAAQTFGSSYCAAPVEKKENCYDQDQEVCAAQAARRLLGGIRSYLCRCFGLVRHGKTPWPDALEPESCLMGLSDLLSFGSGSLVGFALGLLGGGGSILAVPLLVYVVGVKDAHIAIGTSALAVSANAFSNLISHSRAGTVKWPCAMVFAVAGITGAAVGAILGRHVDGQHLLFFFGLAMLVVAGAMFCGRAAGGDPLVHIDRQIAVRLAGIGLVVGFLSGFFGIGGGFLIGPAIMMGSGMTAINAVGSSLVSVGAFGLTTAATYAVAGLVDWRVAAIFVIGGIAGGLVGVQLSVRLSKKRGALSKSFAVAVILVAAFVLWKSSAGILR
jgi:uncharacterized membrane protein YfcA